MVAVAALVVVVGGAAGAAGEGAGLSPLWGPRTGCHDVRSFGSGMIGDGAGTIEVPAGPGPVVAAYLQWVGSDDLTPQLQETDGAADSTLVVNGAEVVGTQPADGYGPEARTFGFLRGWFAWYADLGPSGAAVVTSASAQRVDVSGWDSPPWNDGRNGAALTIVYDLGDCGTPRQAAVYAGMDVYWHGLPTKGFAAGSFATQVVGLPFDAAPWPRLVTVNLFHAGTDAGTTDCRGTALWFRAGRGAPPAGTLGRLVDRRSYDGPGHGVSGGVEIVNDPFPSGGCTPRLHPAPDSAYEDGHPYPLGASQPPEAGGAPYRVRRIEHRGCACPAGQAAEWDEVTLQVEVPAGTEWVAFQLESEADQHGESGAWGASYALVEPATPTLPPSPTIPLPTEPDPGPPTTGTPPATVPPPGTPPPRPATPTVVRGVAVGARCVAATGPLAGQVSIEVEGRSEAPADVEIRAGGETVRLGVNGAFQHRVAVTPEGPAVAVTVAGLSASPETLSVALSSCIRTLPLTGPGRSTLPLALLGLELTVLGTLAHLAGRRLTRRLTACAGR